MSRLVIRAILESRIEAVNKCTVNVLLGEYVDDLLCGRFVGFCKYTIEY